MGTSGPTAARQIRERLQTVRTIARNHTRIIAQLRQDLPLATRHSGAHDITGTPVPALEAWNHYEHGPERGQWPLLRELDPRAGTYEIRVSGKLRYELRRPVEQHTQRIDVVVDRDPDNETGVTVYLNGTKTTSLAIGVHVIDPGASGATHEWLEANTEHDDKVPEAVSTEINGLVSDYHARLNHCRRNTCDG